MTLVAPARRSPGRPRRISLDQVIAAGCELGLDNLDMVSVARRLGAGVATLYGYVEDRDHLLRLVADELSRPTLVEDRGQDWAKALREHAEVTFQIYRARPHLISHLIDGTSGDRAYGEHTDALLHLLMNRGIEPADALALFFQTNQIVIGAAVSVAYHDRLRKEAGGEGALIRKLRAGCEAGALFSLRQCLDTGKASTLPGDYRPTLERIISDQMRKMQEP